jgi:sarcosine oxidase gamma subunit
VTRALFLLSFCSFAIAQTPASSVTDWRFAHPDADMKMNVNVQALLKSDAIAKAIEQAKTQAKDNAMQIQMALAMLQTVDRLSVSFRRKGSEAPDVLAQVTGSFDPQFIAGMFPSTGTSQVKVVGPHTLLIGEGNSFTQSVARMAGSVGPVSGDDLEQNDIWIQMSGEMLTQQAGQQGSPLLKDVRALSIGLTLGATPEVNLVLSTTDDAGAAAMLKMIQAMTPMLVAYPATAGVAKDLMLTQDGSRLRIHFVVPPELQAEFQQQAASVANNVSPMLGTFGLGGSSKQSAKAPAAPPPPPQNGGPVRIYGLDDGTKEFAAPK